MSETDFFDKPIHISWVMLAHDLSLSLFQHTLLFIALMLSVEQWLMIFVLIGNTPDNLFLGSTSSDVRLVTTKSSPRVIPDIMLPLWWKNCLNSTPSCAPTA